MFGSRRVLAQIAIAVCITVGTGSAGCANKMEKVEVPASGVKLSYDLAPGTSFTGHVRVGNTLRLEAMGGGNLKQAIECKVNMTVLGDDEQRGGKLVQATFVDVKLDWALPPTAPFSADEFLKLAADQVRGMQVTFNVLESGKITFMPPVPADAPDQLKLVIANVLDALEAAFLVVPQRALKAGETWSEQEKRGRKGKLGRYREGTVKTTFDGLYRQGDGAAQVAKLTIKHDREEVITTKEGRRRNERKGETTAYFSTDGYLAEIDSEIREFDPNQGMNFRKVRVEWSKATDGPLEVTAPAAVAGEVQAISDPCDPDYVGAQECAEEVQAVSDPCDPDYVGAQECPNETPTPPSEGETAQSAAPAQAEANRP